MSNIRQALPATLLLTLCALVVLSSTGGYPRIRERDLQIQLNILKMKRDDATRARLVSEIEDPEYEMGGSYTWQNRIIVPVVLTAFGGFARMLSLDSRLVMRATYAMMIAAAIFGVFLTVHLLVREAFVDQSWRPPLGGPQADGSGQQLLVANLAAAWSAIFLCVGIVGSPSTKFAADYLEIVIICFVLHCILADRPRALVAGTLVWCLIRESAIFAGPIYVVLRSREMFESGTSFRREAVTALGLSLMAAATVILVRAYFLGGVQYAFGLGGEHGYAAGLWLRFSPALDLVQSRYTHTFIGLLFAGSLLAWWRGVELAPRFITAAAIVTVVSLPFGKFSEPRVYYQLLPLLIVPFTFGLASVCQSVGSQR